MCMVSNGEYAGVPFYIVASPVDIARHHCIHGKGGCRIGQHMLETDRTGVVFWVNAVFIGDAVFMGDDVFMEDVV